MTGSGGALARTAASCTCRGGRRCEHRGALGLQAPPGPGPERPRFGGGLETLGWVHTEEGFKREFFAPQLAKL